MKRHARRSGEHRRLLCGLVHSSVEAVSPEQLLKDGRAQVIDVVCRTCLQACITSPPYWGLRDYGAPGQLGLEADSAEYVAKLVEIFRGVRRVLRHDGTLWLNLGDTYIGGRSGGAGKSGLTSERNHSESRKAWVATGGRKHRVVQGFKAKDLVGIPWMVAFALRADGWYLRSDIIWHKPNPMPSAARDRPTSSHEHVFLLSKRERYFYDGKAIAEPLTCPEASQAKDARRAFSRRRATAPEGRQSEIVLELDRPIPTHRNKRDVWTLPSQPYHGAHRSTFPPALPRLCIRAATRIGDTVLDPFFGAGTTGLEALRLQRSIVGIEINHDTAIEGAERLRVDSPLLNRVEIVSPFGNVA